MEAIRQFAEVRNGIVTVQLPASFQARHVEVIVLAQDGRTCFSHTVQRRPSPLIAGQGKILGDIVSPAAPEEDWDVLVRPAL